MWLLEAPVRKIILQMHTPARSSQCWSRQTPAWTQSVHLDAPRQRHGQQPVSGTADPGVVKQDKSSRGSVDTTKTRSGPQRVRMSSGKRPIGAAKGKQSDTEALCQTPPPRGRRHRLTEPTTKALCQPPPPRGTPRPCAKPPPVGPPPPQTKGTIVGKTEVDRWENLIGPFLVDSFGSQTPPPSLLPPCPWGLIRGGGGMWERGSTAPTPLELQMDPGPRISM